MQRLGQSSCFLGQTGLKIHKLDLEVSIHFRFNFFTQICEHQTLIASNGHFVINLEGINS
jgi:hypothetical protein